MSLGQDNPKGTTLTNKPQVSHPDSRGIPSIIWTLPEAYPLNYYGKPKILLI